MSLSVKICGLNTAESVAAALDAGADMAGLVFFPASPRFLQVNEAVPLAALVRGRAEIVALIVDLDDRSIDRIVSEIRPDWLQLHGRETPERTEEIRRRSGIRVMKAIGVRTKTDLAQATVYAEVADRLLIDAKPPEGADRPGGHGRTFDWEILRGFAAPREYLLSGGLNPENVGDAIARTGAAGVDVSSGVETAPGKKSLEKIRAFVAAARRAEAARASLAMAVNS